MAEEIRGNNYFNYQLGTSINDKKYGIVIVSSLVAKTKEEFIEVVLHNVRKTLENHAVELEDRDEDVSTLVNGLHKQYMDDLGIVLANSEIPLEEKNRLHSLCSTAVANMKNIFAQVVHGGLK